MPNWQPPKPTIRKKMILSQESHHARIYVSCLIGCFSSEPPFLVPLWPLFCGRVGCYGQKAVLLALPSLCNLCDHNPGLELGQTVRHESLIDACFHWAMTLTMGGIALSLSLLASVLRCSMGSFLCFVPTAACQSSPATTWRCSRDFGRLVSGWNRGLETPLAPGMQCSFLLVGFSYFLFP